MSYKVKFDTGETVEFKSQPTDKDIEDVVKKLGIKPKKATIPEEKSPIEAPTYTDPTKIDSRFKGAGIMNALLASEQGLAKDIGQGIFFGLGGGKTLDNAVKSYQDFGTQLANQASRERDVEKKKQLLRASTAVFNESTKVREGIVGKIRTPEQVVGDAIGVGADILLAGSYGKAKSGAKFLPGTGSIANFIGDTAKLTKGVKTIAQPVAKQALGQTLKTIAKKTTVNSAVGAGTGYTYDVAGNLQEGKTGLGALKPGLGTVIGAAIPISVGTIRTGAAITRETAPRFINSLIKPSKANFAYGKDPGRTVSAMGITGNSLDDFANNIRQAKQDIGSQLSVVYSDGTKQGIKINANSTTEKLDDAIREAAKGGKNNQNLVTTLNNIKDALLYEHTVNVDGEVVKVGAKPIDLSKLNPEEVFKLKSAIAEMTKFTGSPSDDKFVNNVLQNIYRDLKGKLNTTLGKRSPEILDLNEKFADLTSAELATRNREAILGRQNLISLKAGGFGTAGAVITAIATGGAAIPTILGGVTVGVLEKAMETTAVKTRIAAWLGKESPSAIQKVLQQNPQIKTLLFRLFPKLSARIGK